MSSALSLLGWTFLPNLVTGWVQAIYYGITIRAGDRKPAPGSPRFNEHRRRIYVLVVSLYLLYTIYEADYDLQRASNFYADLGVPLTATDRDVKSRFRRLAALHHPDKVGGSHSYNYNSNGGSPESASSSTASAGDFFMHLKTASDTLTDPARRFAYERFGPDMVEWKHCVTVRDFVLRGCQILVPYYGGAAVVMYVLGVVGYLEFGRYWRWLTLSLLFVFELHTVTRPAPPALFAAVVNPLLARFTAHPPYLPFQVITLARKVSFALFVAFSQIGPLLQSAGGRQQRPGGGDGAASDKALAQALERLEQATRSMETDANRLLELEMAPFAGDHEAQAGMRAKLQHWLVQNTIRSDPMVQDAMGRSLRKRRVDAPAGARGNR